MALAPPPPLQIDAKPFCPFLSWCANVPVIRAPLAPIGCPRATAPPLMFTLVGSRPRIFTLAKTTTLNASFNSNIEMSSFFTPVCLRSFWTAKTGAIGKSIGAVAASQKPTIRANGLRLCFLTVSSSASSTAPAPSFNLLALAAVIVPFTYIYVLI